MAAVSPAGPDPQSVMLRLAVILLNSCCGGVLFRAAGLPPSRYDNESVKILDNIRSDEYARECSGMVVKPGAKSPRRSASLCDQRGRGPARPAPPDVADLRREGAGAARAAQPSAAVLGARPRAGADDPPHDPGDGAESGRGTRADGNPWADGATGIGRWGVQGY